MSWDDIENAVHAVIVRSSELAADRVTWAHQNVNEPELDHVVISFGGARSVGIDRIATSQDLTRANGQEMGQRVRGVREVPLNIECYSTAVTGEGAARYMAELIRTRFRLHTSIAALQKVQLSVFDTAQPINWIPYIPSSEFRGRALLTVRCYAPVMDVIEYNGYISRILGVAYPVGWQGGPAPTGASGIAFDSANAP